MFYFVKIERIFERLNYNMNIVVRISQLSWTCRPSNGMRWEKYLAARSRSGINTLDVLISTVNLCQQQANLRNVSKQLNRFDTAETLAWQLARTVFFNLVKELLIRTSNSMTLNMFRINHKPLAYLIQIEHVKMIKKYV